MAAEKPLGFPDASNMLSWTESRRYPPAFVPVAIMRASHESLAIALLPPEASPRLDRYVTVP